MSLLKKLSKRFSGSNRSQYGIPSRTLHGEIVRSHAEQRIADYFVQNGIRYQYETGARTDALLFKKTFAHPDFYLTDYGIYVEYWGLVNASKEYRQIMKWKMKQYRQNHIRFISLYPDNMGNLDWIFRAKFRETAGFDLPAKPTAVAGMAKFCIGCGTPIGPPGKFCIKCGSPVSMAVG